MMAMRNEDRQEGVSVVLVAEGMINFIFRSGFVLYFSD